MEKLAVISKYQQILLEACKIQKGGTMYKLSCGLQINKY